jgi:hypothetical protein
VIAVQPVADNLSNGPRIARNEAVRGPTKCVEIVLLGKRARSIARTLKRRRARSIAKAALEQRVPVIQLVDDVEDVGLATW